MRIKNLPLLLAAVVLLVGLSGPSLALAQEGSGDGGEIGPRIVGGREAKPGAWPWVVQVNIYTASFLASCGGSILTNRVVLTAAHCLDETALGEAIARIDVIAGRHNATTAEGQVISAAARLQHSRWNVLTRDSDAGIIVLSKPLVFNDRVAPVTLLTPEAAILTRPGAPAIVVGWGTTSFLGGASDVLLQAQVPIVSQADCNGPNSYNGLILDSMICAGHLMNGGVDSCQGDSGGPLVVSDGNDGWRQAGITSGGLGCAFPNFPGIYARVSKLYPWISYFPSMPATCNGLPPTIIADPAQVVINGTAGNDVIIANNLGNRINGNGGDDTICARGGDDGVSAGSGNDWVDGGDGNDEISGGPGDDDLRGGLGDDTLTGGGGNDRLDGNKGNDRLKGNQGDDVLLGQLGDDALECGPGVDLANGGPGQDTPDAACETLIGVP